MNEFFTPGCAPALDFEAMDEAIALLRQARAIQVVGHVRPDGDCLGSILGVHHLLAALDKSHALAVESIGLDHYRTLPGFELITDRPDPAFNADLVICVDTATADRGLGSWQPMAPVLNIDHHGSNPRYGQVNWIEPSCASTTEMIFFLARRGGWPLTAQMAEALLIGLVTDTGSFRFANAGARQMRVAAELIDAGASNEQVARVAFCGQSLESTRIVAHVLAGVQLACEGRLAWSQIRQQTYHEFGGERNAPENLANQLRSIRGVEVGVLFSETSDGHMRVNFRSEGAVNVSELAARWGGGGHPCAAGLTIPLEDFDTQRDHILAHISQAITQACAPAE